MRWTRAFLTLAAWAVASCSTEEARSPFGRDDAGADVYVEADADPEDAGDFEPDPSLGGPCLDDAQCDDGIDCTADRCDPELKRCRFTPDDSLCQDGVYCNGNEVCDLRLGCRPGEPVTCSDQDACTIERCVEETRSCERAPRDADGDGDPDHHCGGGDCDDDDPLVSSDRLEICGNGKDDDCDGLVDDEDDGCVVPAHDRCDDAFVIEAPGNYAISLLAALPDYAATCAPTGPGVRDVVASIRLPEGPPRDVDVVATTSSPSVAIAMPERCGEPGAEFGCHGAMRGASGNAIARIRARELPPGTYSLYVFTEANADVALRVRFLDPTPKPDNETCGTARELEPFTQVPVSIIDVERDVGSACATELGDLVYAFTLEETRDVRLRATSEDGLGEAVLSLRTEACALPEDEITCVSGSPAVLYARSLPAGTYFVAVSATTPTDLKLVLEVFDPTEAPADEVCDGAPPLRHNVTIDVDLAGHTDDVRTGCSTGFADAAYTLVLDEPSDVLLVQRFAQGDHGAVQLAMPACASPEDRLACGLATQSPARASARKVPPGEYRAIVESRYASEVKLTAFVRPYAPPTLVAFADRCDDAVVVPKEGGFFQGNTANAAADYPAGCDYGSGASAPDQMLRLDLDERKRVVLDMSGSGYQTLLNIRRGPDCPGTEVESSCDVGASASRSYLDRVLEPGTYWIQIDGFAGAAGPWFLDVRIVDP